MRVLLRGMHGLGDCVHQRAVVRALKKDGHTVAIETPWPQLYGDMESPLFLPETTLRTQHKNCVNLSKRVPYLEATDLPKFDAVLKNWYTGGEVRQYGFVGAMLHRLSLPWDEADFKINVPPINNRLIEQVLPMAKGKPIMIYRPLVDRKEWDGCENRNPVSESYAALFEAIREKYFVISIADLVPEVEWISGIPIKADMELHNGEVNLDALLWLFSVAAMVFCSPGFALPLAQAVGTPVICVFGGRENSKLYTQNAATLGVDTITPCDCFDHRHACVKTIDLKTQIPRVKAFAGVP